MVRLMAPANCWVIPLVAPPGRTDCGGTADGVRTGKRGWCVEAPAAPTTCVAVSGVVLKAAAGKLKLEERVMILPSAAIKARPALRMSLPEARLPTDPVVLPVAATDTLAMPSVGFGTLPVLASREATMEPCVARDTAGELTQETSTGVHVGSAMVT